MSDNSSPPDPSATPAGPWAVWFDQADAQGKAILDCFQAFGDPQAMQRRWLDALSRNLDGYMRSPAFLEAMQRNLKAMTDLKAFQDQIVQELARHVGVPLASDIHGLFERLHSVEHTILDRLRAIEGRLASIEEKLGGGPGQG